MESAVALASVLSLASPLRHAVSLMPFHRAACRLPPPTQDRSRCKNEMVPGIGQKADGRGQNVAYRNSPHLNLPIIFRPGAAIYR
jgi:hypothetical protein